MRKRKQLIVSPKKWTNVTTLGSNILIDVTLEGNVSSIGIIWQNIGKIVLKIK